jgi:hypothetical protein
VIESALEQVEHQRSWRDEENEYPDRPMVESIVELVAMANLPVTIALYE